MKHPNEEFAVATVRTMADESLNPDDHTMIVVLLDRLCDTRAANINNEIMRLEYIKLSGRDDHASDCSVNWAPAELPKPCDCKYSDPSKNLTACSSCGREDCGLPLLHDTSPPTIEELQVLVTRGAPIPTMRSALEALLNRYVSLVQSGDGGDWDAEIETEVINARAALTAPVTEYEQFIGRCVRSPVK
jgi:hypothetical protein